jgi:flavin-dependent dehydrogenase
MGLMAKTPSAVRDVAIVGGGLAGLTLARQLKLARPTADIVVVERGAHPVPEAAFKVGESTAEMAGHYFGTHLGLRNQLEERQLIKTGLRFFFSAGGNRDIALRPEVGHLTLLPTRTFQLDRGRLENDLTEDVRSLGVEVLEGVRVIGLDAHGGAHVLTVVGRRKGTIAARWVVDASGRPGFLKRQLGLGRRLDHNVNAAWFRLADRVDVQDWSSDSAWRARLPDGFRWRSTCHLSGRGYWFWVIALASGSTSFGLVADPAWHPLETYNTFDRMLQWLDANEPQAAAEIGRRRHLLQDFRAFRHFATDCAEVFSPGRWSIVGEAGKFLDPLYSNGSDVIALENTLTTALVVADLDGEGSLERRVAIAADAFDVFFDYGLDLYRGQYGIFGDALAMTAKSFWDTISYYAVFALLFCQGKYLDLPFLAEMMPAMKRVHDLNVEVQRGLLAAATTNQQAGASNPNLAATGSWERDYSMFLSFTRDMVRPMSEARLRRQIDENVAFLEGLAAEVVARASGAPSPVPARPAPSPRRLRETSAG